MTYESGVGRSSQDIISINVKVMQELKYELFNDFQAADKEVSVY